MLLHIIYTQSAMFLSKATYPSWKDIQGEFSDYQSSLGPWEGAAVLDYFQGEYSDFEPSAEAQVTEFLQSDLVLKQLSFLPKFEMPTFRHG